MKFITILPLLFFALSLKINAEGLNLFWLRDLESNTGKKIGFVSVTGNYPLNAGSKSLSDTTDVFSKKLQYFKLSSGFKSRLLPQLGLSEIDS